MARPGATGDGPRSDDDWSILASYIEEESAAGTCTFLIHLGDIWRRSGSLPESHYARVAELLKTSDIPWFIVPGDNEWNDLEDPDTGWANWVKHFTDFELNFPKAPVAAHQENRAENVAWVRDDVLFMEINLVGGRVHDGDEWRRRHADNVAWVDHNLNTRGNEIRAAVVFAQAAPKEKQENFFNPFVELVRTFDRPVLYLHGDGHT